MVFYWGVNEWGSQASLKGKKKRKKEKEEFHLFVFKLSLLIEQLLVKPPLYCPGLRLDSYFGRSN